MTSSLDKIIPIRAFKDNYIWMFFDETSRAAFVVDPGDANPVRNMLKEKNFELAGILITHHHFDHTGGVAELLSEWPTIPVYGSHQSPIQQINHRLKENDKITCLPSFQFQILEIPGHTHDHLAYFNDDILFSGDTLFSAGCGRVFEGTPMQMYHSLNKMMQLKETTRVFCGHEYTLANLQFANHVEPNNAEISDNIRMVNQLIAQNKPSLPSTLEREKQINPFLRCTQPTIIQAVEKHVNKPLTAPVDVFTYLREWKNNFTL